MEKQDEVWREEKRTDASKQKEDNEKRAKGLRKAKQKER
jgi:hypothetical protein